MTYGPLSHFCGSQKLKSALLCSERERTAIPIFPFGPKAKKIIICNSIYVTFQKREQISRDLLAVRRENGVKFSVSPSTFALETLTWQC